jgi:16S rRNA (cytosine967-C5)-methyltransferase
LKKKNARNIALEALYAVMEEGAFSNITLNKVLEKYRPEKIDRGFITELLYGTIRTLGTIDWILGNYLKKPLHDLPAWIRNILRLGVYQIYYLGKVPDSAACNESANLAKNYGHAGTVKLVNGVLRNVARNKENLSFPDIEKDPVQAVAIRYSHPEWMVERWIKEFGINGAVDLCQANNQIPPNSIRTNTLKTSREELKQILIEQGIEAKEGSFAPETLVIDGFKSVGSLESHSAGLFMVQDESSTLVGHALKPEPGSVVMDVCSAPGGKTTHLAQLMKNQGRIICGDIHPHKLHLIKENTVRLGIGIIEPEVWDAIEIHHKYARTADYILVDAPCSGLGVLRRRPEIKWKKTSETVNELQNLQLKILSSAARCLKPGGVLVYSTCTVTHEENIDVVTKFLNGSEGFKLESLKGFLPEKLTSMPFTQTMEKGYVQFMSNIHGTDGFFIVRFRKRKG